MKRYIICIICSSCLFFSCEKSTNSQATYSEKLYNRELTDSLHNRALHHGDTAAYLKLRAFYYIGGPRNSSFLYYALVMSNRYNYNEAADDVYFILTSDSILDDKTREMADYYLLKSKGSINYDADVVR